MIKALRGTRDILPEEMPVWQFIETSARHIFSQYGYREIRTPLIEEAGLFIRGIGDTTDIVQKEMYTFNDRGGRLIALRPEGTSSIVRAYIENSLGQRSGITKLFYIGPMFRGERPQKGRYRQFHQIGVEAIGSDNPFLDAEVITLAVRLLERLGVDGFQVYINSLGCPTDKIGTIDKYREMIRPYLNDICVECNRRFEKNVLRILDCKNEKCRSVLGKIKMDAILCSICKEHFEMVKKNLDLIGIPYLLDTKIVRGLDYYTKTVFEITQQDLGSKDAICAGGRFNNLIKSLGGRDTPAIGFAFGIERLIISIKNSLDRDKIEAAGVDVFITVINEGLRREAFRLMDILRKEGFSSDMAYEAKELRSQLGIAEKVRARFAVIFGEDEFKKGRVLLKDMEKREQREVDLDKIINEITSLKR